MAPISIRLKGWRTMSRMRQQQQQSGPGAWANAENVRTYTAPPRLCKHLSRLEIQQQGCRYAAIVDAQVRTFHSAVTVACSQHVHQATNRACASALQCTPRAMRAPWCPLGPAVQATEASGRSAAAYDHIQKQFGTKL